MLFFLEGIAYKFFIIRIERSCDRLFSVFRFSMDIKKGCPKIILAAFLVGLVSFKLMSSDASGALILS